MAKKHASRNGSKVIIQKSGQKATDPQKERRECNPEKSNTGIHVLEMGIEIIQCQSAAKSWQALLASKLESFISGQSPTFDHKEIAYLIKKGVEKQEFAIRQQAFLLAMVALRLENMVPAELESRFNKMMDEVYHATQHLTAKNNLPGQAAATGGEIRKGSGVSA
jgi:hypothetical protein